MFVAVQPPVVLEGGSPEAVRRPFRSRVLATIEPYLYVAPALAGVGLWIYYPILRTLRLSTVRWNLLPTKPKVPVGLDNYRDVLSLPEMRQAV